MSTLDIILAGILLIGAIKGYTNGLVVEIFAFFAFFLGLFIALELTIPVASHFFDGRDYYEIASVGIFIALFILTSFLVKLLARMIKRALDLTLLGRLDSLFGAIVGAVKWAFAVSIIFWVFESVGFDLAGNFTEDARLLPYIVKIGPWMFEWISTIIPYFENVIDSMKNLSKGNASYNV